MSWVVHYVVGTLLFSAGMGWAIGWPGAVIAIGFMMMLGGFGQFLLEKVRDIVVVSSHERQP